MSKLTIDLVREAIAGSRPAFGEIVAELTPVIHARVARLLVRYRGDASWDPRQEVRDFVQQVFVALFEDDARVFRTWDPQRGRSLTSFVCLVADHEVISTLRTRARNPWSEVPTEPDETAEAESDAGPESLTASRETLSAILVAVRARLGERGIELFRMIVAEERPIDEIAEVTGMTRDAIYAWHSRFRRLVREIGDELASEPAPAPRKGSERAS